MKKLTLYFIDYHAVKRGECICAKRNNGTADMESKRWYTYHQREWGDAGL